MSGVSRNNRLTLVRTLPVWFVRVDVTFNGLERRHKSAINISEAIVLCKVANLK